MSNNARAWLNPGRHAEMSVTNPAERRALTIEVVLVFAITLGLSGLRSLLSLVDSLLRPQPLSQQQVSLNVPQAAFDLIDLLKQLLGVVQLVGWAGIGLYLLWRGGIRPSQIGLNRRLVSGNRLGSNRLSGDIPWSIGLAALIGIPGLAFYLVSYQLGFSLNVQPSTLNDTWWRPILLVLAAFGNAFAEEVLVVGYLLTRLRQLGRSENSALMMSAILRGSYHLYQGFGGFVGNVIMGLVFGRVWQRKNRLWPLVFAHTILDVVAFVGYALLKGHLSWLP